MDGYLNIQTTDVIHYDKQSSFYEDYFESEPTHYRDLKELVKHYRPTLDQPYLLDFGCGTGRALFFMHHFLQVPASGVEFNPETFQRCQMNLVSYQSSHPSSHPLDIHWSAAEDFEVLDHYNIFYFFNPFSLDIFRQVMKRILASYQASIRPMELILYYPTCEYEDYLLLQTPFQFRQSIDLPWYAERIERFDIYHI